MLIGEITEQPSAQWPYEKTRREQQRGVELLHHGIGVREEGSGEIERKRRIGVEVVPLDQIADRADEDRLDAAPHVGEVEVAGVFESGGSHGQAREQRALPLN
jgi:hypothetical protein